MGSVIIGLFILFMFMWLFDMIFPLLLIGTMVIVFMSATHMIEWNDNKPDINIERGIEWIKQHDGNGNWVGPTTEADQTAIDAEAKRQRLMDNGGVIIQ